MNKRDAKALGRWCDEHNRQYERVHLPNGAAVTGCRECAAAPGFVAAMDSLVAAARASKAGGVTLKRWLRHDPRCAVSDAYWPAMLLDHGADHDRCDCGLMEAVRASESDPV